MDNLNLDTQHRREILQKSIDESEEYQKTLEDLKKLFLTGFLTWREMMDTIIPEEPKKLIEEYTKKVIPPVDNGQ